MLAKQIDMLLIAQPPFSLTYTGSYIYTYAQNPESESNRKSSPLSSVNLNPYLQYELNH